MKFFPSKKIAKTLIPFSWTGEKQVRVYNFPPSFRPELNVQSDKARQSGDNTRL